MSDQFQLQLTPDSEAAIERDRLERETRYRRAYWQKYKESHVRVFGTGWNSTDNPSASKTLKQVTPKTKSDTPKQMPHGNASKVGGCPGTSGRMLSEQVGGYSGIRTLDPSREKFYLTSLIHGSFAKARNSG